MNRRIASQADTRRKFKYALLVLIGLILSPLAVAHASPPIDYEQWRHDHPHPAGKLADLNVGEPRTVRMIYFVPNDRLYNQAVVDSIKSKIGQVQVFFFKQMGTHGYRRNRTFRFETDAQGKPRVHRVNGRHPARGYYDQTYSEESEVREVFDPEANVYLIVIDNGYSSVRSYAGGLGGRRSKNGGVALVSSSFFISTAAHELGHAFGLSHDFRDDTYVMSYGPSGRRLFQQQLSDCNAEFLAVHPYFNPTSPIEKGSPPIIEQRTPSTVYTVGLTSTPIQIGARSVDKLHQAILLAYTPAIHNSLSVKACRGLGNKENTVVTFDYDGGIPGILDSELNSFETQGLYIKVTNAVGDVVSTGRFELINTKIKKPISTFRFTEDKLSKIDDMVFSPDGELLAVEEIHSNGKWGGGGIKLWNGSTSELIPVPVGRPLWQPRYGDGATFSPDSKLLAFLFDGSIKIWDRLNRRYIATFFRDAVSLTFSPDLKLLTSYAEYADDLEVWDVLSEKHIVAISARHIIVGRSFSSDGKLLALQHLNNRGYEIDVWDVFKGKHIFTAPDDDSAHSFGFSPNSKLLVARYWSGKTYVWDVETGQLIYSLPTSSESDESDLFLDWAFSPDGKLLATCNSVTDRVGPWRERRSAGIKLWDVETGQLITTLPGAPPFSFSPDGKLLASKSSLTIRDGEAGYRWYQGVVIKLWDVATSQIITSFPEGKFVSRLVFSPNGQELAALTRMDATTIGNNQVDLWSLSESADGATPPAGDSDGDELADLFGAGKLTPDPAEVAFSADDPAWKTFTVHTNLDSVLVRANPSGSDPALEVAGGQQVPTRDYCPAEGNDRPTRGRRDGWSLHVKACQAGQTKILLIDYDTGVVVQEYEVTVEASTSAAVTTALNPSYPNPFNSETILSYTLPTAADIRLEVFTLTGQRVAVLHEGFQAAGYHTLSLDASALASGVYLYRLTTPQGRFVQKFTLLR